MFKSNIVRLMLHTEDGFTMAKKNSSCENWMQLYYDEFACFFYAQVSMTLKDFIDGEKISEKVWVRAFRDQLRHKLKY